MGRVKSDNFLWICCCCGCLPLIGLIKGAILCVPILIIHFIPCTLIALVLLPHDIFYTYYTILATKKLGRNIKVLAVLLLPLPLFLWPPCVLLLTIIIGGGMGLFYPVYLTFDDDVHVLGGWIETFTRAFKNVKEFYDFDTNSYFVYLDEFRNAACDTPFDIKIIEIFIGLIIAIFGVIIDGISITLLAILKFPFSIPKMYYELWNAYFKQDCLQIFMFGIFFIIGNALVPVGAALALGIVIIGGLCVGLGSAGIAYSKGIVDSFKWQLDMVYKFDKQSNSLIFGSDTSFLPCCHFENV